MPHKDPEERRAQVRRDVKRHREATQPNPIAFATKATFNPPALVADTIPLRTSSDVIGAFELVASTAYRAYRADELDLCSCLRLITGAASGASRCQDAAAIEARLDDLELQRSA